MAKERNVASTSPRPAAGYLAGMGARRYIGPSREVRRSPRRVGKQQENREETIAAEFA